jgi:hypothetical protein
MKAEGGGGAERLRPFFVRAGSFAPVERPCHFKEDADRYIPRVPHGASKKIGSSSTTPTCPR